MNLGRILQELKYLDIYSPDEWEEYLSYFENNKKIFQCLKKNIDKNFAGGVLERIKNGQGTNVKKIKAGISIKITGTDYLSNHEKRSSMTLGVVSGSYDLLHLGHIRGFAFAEQFLGQYANPRLCALVLSDKSIKGKKGESRPILNINERLEMLCNVECVDYVVPIKSPDCLQVLEKIKPDYFFKAGRDNEQEIVKKEIDLVESYGGVVIVFPSASEGSISTTKIIETMLKEGFDANGRRH